MGAAYSLVTDVRKEREAEIRAGLEDLQAEREKLLSGRDDTLKTITELNLNLDQASEDVRDNFAAIRDALERREKETLLALQDLKNAKQRVLTTQVQGADVRRAFGLFFCFFVFN